MASVLPAAVADMEMPPFSLLSAAEVAAQPPPPSSRAESIEKDNYYNQFISIIDLLVIISYRPLRVRESAAAGHAALETRRA